MIAGGYSIGAGEEVFATMTGWQGVVGMHNLPRYPTGLAADEIVSLYPCYPGSVGKRNPGSTEQPGRYHAGLSRQLPEARHHGSCREALPMECLLYTFPSPRD